ALGSDGALITAAQSTVPGWACPDDAMIAHRGERRAWFIMAARHERGRAPPPAPARSPPGGNGLMNLQDANWERFCRYHVGDWYGLWTPYTLDGVALAPWHCIRSFRLTVDGRAITHQNHYCYADGRQEPKTFGPYPPATTPAAFVETSFSL